MKTTTRIGQVGDIAMQRRSFLRMIATGAVVIGVPSLLTGCTTAAPKGAVVNATAASNMIPSYIPVSYATPDFPSVNGSTPGYLTMPTKLVQSVAKAPGSGTSFKVMTPLYGTIPSAAGNQYFDAVNAMLGSKVDFQFTDGNVYGDKLATVLASVKDVPDWVVVPYWFLPPRFGSEIVENVFEDLTPFLAGDKAKDYPNLANLPSDAWKFCVFNGKLYGLPVPGQAIDAATFYRKDLIDALGIKVDVKNGDDLLALALELTDATAGRWGAEDLWRASTIIHAVPPAWKLDGGKLVNRVETAEYRAALEWNAKLFASGAVHPDAVAGSGDIAKRFGSGKSLIRDDGVTGWPGSLSNNRASIPTFWQQPFDPFAADGGKPVLFKAAPAAKFSFLKKSDDKKRIAELLGMANALAAPFGTTEFNLVTYGVEGVHYTKDAAGVPVLMKTAGNQGIGATYIGLVSPPVANTFVQYPDYVRASSTWQTKAAGYLTEPVFYGRQITEPQKFASIAKPFTDLEKDISRGRKTLKDLDMAVATWKAAGGDELRAFYQGILDAK
jgi:putative aldouronate transport system substrate-binding protein